MCEDAQLCEFWIWDGDVGHVLGLVEGMEDKFLIEYGVLTTEDDKLPGVKELLKGDPVYRLRTARALDMSADPREKHFQWQLVNPYTGQTQSAAYSYEGEGLHEP